MLKLVLIPGYQYDLSRLKTLTELNSLESVKLVVAEEDRAKNYSRLFTDWTKKTLHAFCHSG